MQRQGSGSKRRAKRDERLSLQRAEYLFGRKEPSA